MSANCIYIRFFVLSFLRQKSFSQMFLLRCLLHEALWYRWWGVWMWWLMHLIQKKAPTEGSLRTNTDSFKRVVNKKYTSESDLFCLQANRRKISAIDEGHIWVGHVLLFPYRDCKCSLIILRRNDDRLCTLIPACCQCSLVPYLNLGMFPCSLEPLYEPHLWLKGV